MGKLDGKVAVITGSSRGIGKATAELFVREGCAVVINGTSQNVTIETARLLEASGGKVIYCLADVTRPDQCQKLMDTAVCEFGRLDILVNAAGITRDNMIHKMTDQQWDMTVDTCLKGAFNCIRAASKYMMMEGHNGRIINVSSMAALRGNIAQVNYVAAKGGLISLTKAVAHEWERFGVTCNCVAYGLVDTRLTRVRESQDEEVAGEKLGISQKARDAALARYNGRIMQPEDAAYPILFLAQDEAWCISGNCLQAAMGGFM